MAVKLGLFDSGLGGLTVVREVRRQLPEASVEFFGDNGRNPYGPLPKETIVRFSREILDFLGGKGIDLAIIACNTATAAALDEVKSFYPFPVIGVIEPGAKAALAASKNKKIGVIGTQFTIESGAYARILKALDPEVEVYGQACPSFTTLVEQGQQESEAADTAAREYLSNFRGTGIDTLVLGCTHYPVLLNVIRRHVEAGVTIVDPAVETVATAKDLLGTKVSGDKATPSYRFYTSGDPELFARLGANILGMALDSVEKVVFPS
ncbi:MAG: glutamate racemase [Desulfofundulus sp.]